MASDPWDGIVGPSPLILPDRPPTKEALRLKGWKETHQALAAYPPTTEAIVAEYTRLHRKALGEGVSEFEKGTMRALSDEVRRRGDAR